MATLRMIPITNTHPAEFVNVDNAASLAIGYTGENVARDGSALLVAPITITHADGVSAVKGGRRELSLGYSLDLEFTPGIFEGKNYDAIQRNIKYNHLALVDSARAGSVTALRLDAQDAVAVGTDIFSINQKTDGGTTVKVFIKGAEHDLPEIVVSHIAELSTRADNAETAAKDANATKDTLQAQKDELAEKFAAAQNADNAGAIAAAAATRAALLVVAEKNIDAAGFAAVKDKPNSEIMAAVIMAKRPGFNADGKSSEYLQARFDSVLEDQQNNDSGSQQANFSQQNQKKQNNDSGSDMEAAYKRQIESYKKS